MRGVRCKLSLADAYLRLVPCVLAWASSRATLRGARQQAASSGLAPLTLG